MKLDYRDLGQAWSRELEEVIEDFELLRGEKRRRKAKLKFFGLDVPNDPDFSKEGLADGFDVNNCSYPSRLITSTWGDFYDNALFGRLGLYCHNFQKGTNFKFVRWEKYNVISTAYDYVYVMWSTLACRIKCNNAVDTRWDDTAVDDFYKGAMPKWMSDEELASDNEKYYVVQESELEENDWLHLFTEIAFYSKTENVLTAPPPLEIEKVVVVTTEDTEEGHEKLKAHNAIFYISYKYNGEYSEWARDHKAVIRKSIDGKPGHMYLEVVAAD